MGKSERAVGRTHSRTAHSQPMTLDVLKAAIRSKDEWAAWRFRVDFRFDQDALDEANSWLARQGLKPLPPWSSCTPYSGADYLGHCGGCDECMLLQEERWMYDKGRTPSPG